MAHNPKGAISATLSTLSLGACDALERLQDGLQALEALSQLIHPYSQAENSLALVCREDMAYLLDAVIGQLRGQHELARAAQTALHHACAAQ